uniref:Uncharacterized protein n=1 Tax=Oncorhynchus tshawytscha TaxID=74940 RepID=A0A8C8D2Y0_ONCTS
RGSASCWDSCCLEPACSAVWSLGGHCVLLNCSNRGVCEVTSLPQPHIESLGLLQLFSKGTTTARRRRLRRAQTGKRSEAVSQKHGSEHKRSSTVIAPSSLLVHVMPLVSMTVRELVVSAGESVEVTLPRNEVELNAFVVPEPQPGTDYAFDWLLRTHPKDYSGEMEGKHSETLKLSKLTVGLYEFEVTVDGDGAHGEGYVNVTVKPEPRVNKLPVAVVSPKFQEISLPTSSTVIDGSQSTDDDKVVAWHWEEVKGPLREEKVSADTQILTLTGLVPGNYTFSLTVTDSDGAQSSTQATLSVNKAVDYRPVANAGPNQVITLPRNAVTLHGNQSTDDHEPLAYEWSLSPESKGKVVEMQGVRTPALQLSAMQEGDYTFQLTVTDTAGQQDTAQVTVIVQPENNKPPVADAGPEKELTLPVDRTTLDGSKSTDDQNIFTYHWKQSKGPDGVKIENADGAVATVTGLQVGEYEFSLTVTDERKLASTDTVTVIVREDVWQRDLVELVLEVSVSQVSHRQRDMLLRQVGVLLGVLDSDIIVREVSAFNEHSTRLVFLVSGGPGRPPLSGHSVALGLRNKLRKQKNDFLIFKARRVDTVICQLNCSSHGDCDSFTRTCICQPFWMENFIKGQLWDQESNCEWSVLYVTIASFMIVVAIATFVWGMVCCCRGRKGKMRHKSKSRYKMLNGEEQDGLELHPPRAGRMKPAPAPSSSALMRSDSDLDSDDGQGGVPWTDRERGHLLRPHNGTLENGQGPTRNKKQREELL